ncbi:glycoside hydrolase family 76 protein [Niabella beijingensis]|uniref:glycoside hydrolase family 76 protein n=1 Tax=Niabella beijingensis TaxID=2872700 RepID=UPI001CBF0B1D|nr:glycoside hydrolase family 76 protein [Niabella beijingensis]MBZ4190202.1 alpha-1,6-mannanase [Niabella beijingensis]
MKKIAIIYSLIIVMFASCQKYDDVYLGSDTARDSFYQVNWIAAADSSTNSFVGRYWNTTQHVFNNTYTGDIQWNDYWPEAHGLDVLVDAYLRTKDNRFKQAIYDFYEGVRKKNWYSDNWENEFYDDMGWHGLAHMRALEATGDQRYAQSSKDLWRWITEGWTDYDGGGIKWRKQSDELKEGKGIPANGPAAIIAARRYKLYPEEMNGGLNNLEWAKRIYNWMKYNRTILSSGRIFENIKNTNNDYSYDVGTYLGAALELYGITKDKTYFDDAVRITNYHITHNIDKSYGVMKDYGEQSGNGGGNDVNLFKGIFVRYFTILIQHPDLPEADRTRYLAFLKNNASYLWIKGTQKAPDIKMSYTWWKIPPDTEAWGDLRAAISGATTIEAMALLQSKGLIK